MLRQRRRIFKDALKLVTNCEQLSNNFFTVITPGVLFLLCKAHDLLINRSDDNLCGNENNLSDKLELV